MVLFESINSPSNALLKESNWVKQVCNINDKANTIQ
jgi:hypothetical protein